jgi:hypothetical protein
MEAFPYLKLLQFTIVGSIIYLISFTLNEFPARPYPSRKSEFMPYNITNQSNSSQTHEVFRVEETQSLSRLEGQIAVLPKVWGYSKERGDELFPEFFYPRCSEINPPQEGASVNLDYSTNTVTMTCPGEFKGKYVLGPIYNIKYTNSAELRKHWKVNYYQGTPAPLNVTNDWIIGSCFKDATRYNLYQHYARFNKSVFLRTHRQMLNLQDQTGTKKKPMLIALFTLDSFSRQHFFRKLPKTVEYLNLLEKSNDWKVFDFKIHNIIGPDTAENQARIFGDKFNGFQYVNITRDLVGDEAIWNKFKDYGFATMLGFDPCAFKMVKAIGRRPKVDHVSETFFCANNRFSGYSSSKKIAGVQRCLGPEMVHYYLMNYTLSFSENYRNLNQWVYNHFGAAHEQSGQHAQTIDEDLAWYIRQYLNRFEDTHEIVFFIMADHGMRYGDFDSDTFAIQEHRLPAFFLLTKRDFLNKIPSSYETLKHNTERLTTKPDIRKTLQYLMRYQYNMPYTDNSNYVNLFTEKVKDSRTCEDVEIPAWLCSQNVLSLIPRYYYDGKLDQHSLLTYAEHELGHLVIYIANEVVLSLNNKVRNSGEVIAKGLCKELSLKEIELVIWDRMRDGMLMKLIIRITESETAKFDSWVIISEKREIEKYGNGLDSFEPFLVTYDSKKLYGHVVMVNRLDSYAGPCEEVMRETQINPEYCICEEDELKMVQEVRQDNFPIN